MNPIPITKLNLNYTGEQKAITSEQFRGAFLDYIRTKFTAQQLKTLPMQFASNKDEEGKTTTNYSFIQYNTYKNELEILSIGEGEEIGDAWLKKVFANDDFTINGKKIRLSNPQKHTEYWYPKLGKHQLYKMQNWIPFGKESIGDESLFNKIIWGNVHRLLDDLEIEFEEKVHIHIHEYKRLETYTKGYNVNWITYNLIFSTNINLPQYIGIGRIISLGAGKIKKISVL